MSLARLTSMFCHLASSSHSLPFSTPSTYCSFFSLSATPQLSPQLACLQLWSFQHLLPLPCLMSFYDEVSPTHPPNSHLWCWWSQLLSFQASSPSSLSPSQGSTVDLSMSVSSSRLVKMTCSIWPFFSFSPPCPWFRSFVSTVSFVSYLWVH